jgi:glucokinase
MTNDSLDGADSSEAAVNGARNVDALTGDGHVAAIDLGGTKILAAIISPGGAIEGRAKKSTGKDHTAGVVLKRMADCVLEAAAAAGVPPSQIKGIGVGSPGPVDPGTGVVLFAPNLQWNNVPVATELEARLHAPVSVDNDVRVAVLAEHTAGAGKGVRNMVGIWPGTGVGGGLVLDGRIYTGARNLAGEIGHITVKAGGPKCGCGGRGHLEALASRTAIVRDLAKAVKRGEKTALTKIVGKNVSTATSGDLAEAWTTGDKLVTKALDRAAGYIAVAIASVANLLNTELIVLGGGVIEALGEPYVEEIRRKVVGLPLATSVEGVRIVKSALGDDAGITGAGILARRVAGQQSS